MDRLTYRQKERQCEATFSLNGPFWHLCTPGQQTEILCESDTDYKFFVTLLAIAAALTGVKIIAFEVMSNHIHVILSGQEANCRELFRYFKDKLKRYYSQSGRYKDLSGFTCELIPIDTLEMMRAEIPYTNRNAYVACDNYTPFTYPWGSGSLYFNPFVTSIIGVPYNSLTNREQREVCQGRVIELPEKYEVLNGMILPQSFCAYKLGEGMFRDAHHYFSAVSKNAEAYSEIAKRLGDTVFLSDEEMIGTLSYLSNKEYGERRPTMLPNNLKIELARRMKQDYNATAGQMQRMLRLDSSIIAELFGK